MPDRAGQRRGERASEIARQPGCNDQTVRYAVRAVNARGLAACRPGSRRAFDEPSAGRLRELLHESPCTFGHPTRLWTLELTAERVSGETIRPP